MSKSARLFPILLALCSSCSASESEQAKVRHIDTEAAGGAGNAAGDGAVSRATGGSGGLLQTNDGSAGVSGGGGGTDVPPPCEEGDIEPEVLPVDMYVLVDHSASMNTMYPGANPPETWWAMVQGALGGFMRIPAAVGLGVGIQYFPLDGPDAGSCDASLYRTPDVPVGLLPGNAAALVQSIQAQVSGGMRPTIPALTGAVDYMRAWAPNHPGRQPVVVLLTDGYPTECPTAPAPAPTDVAAVARDASNGTPRILTFVIGLSHSGPLDGLDDIAAAGGTGKSFQISGGDLGAQITHAMLSIASTPLSCVLYLPASVDSTGSLSTNLISVHYIDATTDVETDVPKVDGPNSCALDANQGWYFDNPVMPQKIVICPGTCSEFATGTVSVHYGCIPSSN